MRPFVFFLAVPLLLAGCESYWERKDLERQLRDMEPRERELRQQIQKLTAGKTTFTEQEKAIIGPLWVELRQIESNMGNLQTQLDKLN